MGREIILPTELEEMAQAVEAAARDLREAANAANSSRELLDTIKTDGKGLLLHTTTVSGIHIPKLRMFAATAKADVAEQIRLLQQGISSRIEYDKKRHAAAAGKKKPPKKK